MNGATPPNAFPTPIDAQNDSARQLGEVSLAAEKQDLPHEMFQEEYVLPLGFVRQGVREVAFDRALTRCVADFVLIFLFFVILLLLHPVSSMFEIQNGMAQALVESSIDVARFRSKLDFNTIQNYDEFWAWANNVLYQKVYNYSLGAYGNYSAYSIASYNRIVTPIRFRQVRMMNESCDATHALSSPCWPASYSSDKIDEAAPGSVGNDKYTSFESGTLYHLLGTHEDYSTYYGTSGHVVDLELDGVLALGKLTSMVRDRWTDEWTRIVAVDVNTYNPNYDIVTVFRFKVERMLGGQLSPRVETCSCRLNPYLTTSDYVRLVLEGIWAVGFAVYSCVTLCRYCCQGLRRSLRKLWTWFQLLYIAWNISMIVFWVLHSMEDFDEFRARHSTQFKDMYKFCVFWYLMGALAAGNAVLGCVLLFNGMRHLPCFVILWKVFAQAVKTILYFSIVVILAIAIFSLGAMWCFGSRVQQLSRWYSAFGTLAYSLITSKDHFSVYEDMRDVSSTLGGIWTVVWIVISFLILINMCVALLTVPFVVISKRKAHEEALERFFPLATSLTYFQSKVRCLWKDPDTLEPVHKLLHVYYVWRPHLVGIDLDALCIKVDKLVDRKEFLFKVSDAMEFFPRRSQEQSYWEAVSWMKSLGRTLGGKMHVPGKSQGHGWHAADTLAGMGMVAAQVKPKSTSFEITMATQSISQLEEEILGLGLQLRKILPTGAPKARYV